MADGIKISGLPQATGITDADVVAGVQNSATKKFPLTVIADWIRSRLTPASIGAQPTITASGILKGDGNGGVSAATAGTDYQAPLVAGTDYQTPLTFDTAPTQNSTNPVTSGGVYTAIRDRNARADSIFSTVTEITSGGITITPTDDWAGYSYLAITLNTSSTNPASERMAVVVPVVLIQFSNWFPVARNGVYGAVQVGRVSNSSQLTFKTDLTSLYVVNVRRVK